jgi:hypothetical protein
MQPVVVELVKPGPLPSSVNAHVAKLKHFQTLLEQILQPSLTMMLERSSSYSGPTIRSGLLGPCFISSRPRRAGRSRTS